MSVPVDAAASAITVASSSSSSSVSSSANANAITIASLLSSSSSSSPPNSDINTATNSNPKPAPSMDEILRIMNKNPAAAIQLLNAENINQTAKSPFLKADTPLLKAISGDTIKWVKEVVNIGAVIDYRALRYAAFKNSPIFKYLLKAFLAKKIAAKNQQSTVIDEEVLSVLSLVLGNAWETDIILMFLAAGVSPDTVRGSTTRTVRAKTVEYQENIEPKLPLIFWAIDYNDGRVISELFARNVNVNLKLPLVVVDSKLLPPANSSSSSSANPKTEFIAKLDKIQHSFSPITFAAAHKRIKGIKVLEMLISKSSEEEIKIAIFFCAANGFKEGLNSLLKHCNNINFTFNTQCLICNDNYATQYGTRTTINPLSLSIRFNPELFPILLPFADQNIIRSALYEAIDRVPNTDIVTTLIARIDKTKPWVMYSCMPTNLSPLMYAINTIDRSNKPETVVKQLIDADCFIDWVDHTGKNALWLAITKTQKHPNTFNIIEMLHKKGIDFQGFLPSMTKGIEVWQTPLTAAALHNLPQLLKVLLAQGIDPCTLDSQGNHALKIALMWACFGAAEILLNNMVEKKVTVEKIQCSNAAKEDVIYALFQGLNRMAQESVYSTCWWENLPNLLVKLINCDLVINEDLLKADILNKFYRQIDTNVRKNNNFSVDQKRNIPHKVLRVMSIINTRIKFALLENLSNRDNIINMQGSLNVRVGATGDTALHRACSHPDQRIFYTLIDYNANINVKNLKGTTPFDLMTASQKNIVTIIREIRPNIYALIREFEAEYSKENDKSAKTDKDVKNDKEKASQQGNGALQKNETEQESFPKKIEKYKKLGNEIVTLIESIADMNTESLQSIKDSIYSLLYPHYYQETLANKRPWHDWQVAESMIEKISESSGSYKRARNTLFFIRLHDKSLMPEDLIKEQLEAYLQSIIVIDPRYESTLNMAAVVSTVAAARTAAATSIVARPITDSVASTAVGHTIVSAASTAPRPSTASAASSNSSSSAFSSSNSSTNNSNEKKEKNEADKADNNDSVDETFVLKKMSIFPLLSQYIFGSPQLTGNLEGGLNAENLMSFFTHMRNVYAPFRQTNVQNNLTSSSSEPKPLTFSHSSSSASSTTSSSIILSTSTAASTHTASSSSSSGSDRSSNSSSSNSHTTEPRSLSPLPSKSTVHPPKRKLEATVTNPAALTADAAAPATEAPATTEVPENANTKRIKLNPSQANSDK